MTGMKSNELNSRKHTLEAKEKQNPDLDLSAEWTALASSYAEAGSRANEQYCRMRAKKWSKEPDSNGYEFDWQKRTDVE